MESARRRHAGWLQTYLTKCIYYLVLESQLPPNNVNIIFQIVIVHKRLTMLRGGATL